MFKLLILICLGTDPSACTPASAVDIVEGGDVSLQQCLFQSQAGLARAGLAGAGKVAKIICAPIAPPKAG